jgi:hypothetical protein
MEISDKRFRILEQREKRRRLLAIINGIIIFWHFLFVTGFAVLTYICSSWRSADVNYIMTNTVQNILPYNYQKIKFKKEFLLNIYSSIKNSTQENEFATIIMMSPIRFNFVNKNILLLLHLF